MVIEIATLTVKEGENAAFEAAFGQAQRYIAQSEHCIRYALTHAVEDASRYVLRIEWDSLEGHVDGFRASAEYQEYRALLYPFYAAPVELFHYTTLYGGDGPLAQA